MSSTRLPGKVLLPLRGTPVLGHILRRIRPANHVDEVYVATTRNRADDLICHVAEREGAHTYRGDEHDVLARFRATAKAANADRIVRICGDSPFVSAPLVDRCVAELDSGRYDYVSNKLDRTFPLGFDVEVFTAESFKTVDRNSTSPNEREHVTVYYRDNPESFSLGNVTAEQMFSDKQCLNRSEIRITLDEADDYRLIEAVYEGIEDDEPTIEDVIRYIDAEGLVDMNGAVKQKSMYDSER
jgi:spore coat polysaccharide biosynthesis protein SpsF